MTDKERQLFARRVMLRRAALLGGMEVVPVLSVDAPELAEQKVPRAWLHYHERGGELCCGRCALFVPGENPHAPGVCRLVLGVIAPSCGCDAFAPADDASRLEA